MIAVERAARLKRGKVASLALARELSSLGGCLALLDSICCYRLLVLLLHHLFVPLLLLLLSFCQTIKKSISKNKKTCFVNSKRECEKNL